MKENNMAYLDIIDPISKNPVDPNKKMLFNLGVCRTFHF
jgi:hypothetical protein